MATMTMSSNTVPLHHEAECHLMVHICSLFLTEMEGQKVHEVGPAADRVQS